MLDFEFSFKKYEKIARNIVDSNYVPIIVRNYIKNRNHLIDKKLIIMRHDVDLKPERALMMAEIEHDLGIKSTYYFRTIKKVLDDEIILEIKKLGHEIGYHYECLDIAKGNFDIAIQLFKEDLEKFRKICNIETICMHGNSWTKWDNRSLWERYDFKDYGIIGEAYLSIDFENMAYISDSSRSWKKKYKIKDIHQNMNLVEIKDSEHLVEVIKGGYYKKIYLLIHPDQWCVKVYDLIVDTLFYLIVNQGKLWIKRINIGNS